MFTPTKKKYCENYGKKVIVPENAKGTTWEEGTIVDLNEKGYLLDFCYPYGIYGMGRRYKKNQLIFLK
jgi:hypothetical protein